MTEKNYGTFLEELLDELAKSTHVYSKDIPSIDLYMDQVTTFMDKNLGILKRNDEDKTLTKTMINNYSKFGLLPPNVKKKYSKEHLELLILIYNLKHSLSIQDINILLSPLKDIVLNDNNTLDLNVFFDRITKKEEEHFATYSKDILDTLELTSNLFPEVSETEKADLSLISTAYLLSVQSAIHKYLATKLIDKYLLEKEATKVAQEGKKNHKKKVK